MPGRFRTALGPLGTTILPRAGQIAVDPGVLVFTFGLALLTGIVFALAPALRLSGGDHRQAISASGLTTRGEAGRATVRAGRVLAVMQLALATTLLVGSGLLLRSFLNLSTVFTGFDPEAQIFQLVSPADYPRARKIALAYDFSRRLQALPGVEAAGFINQPPLISARVFQNLYLPPAFEAQRDSLTERDRTTIRAVNPDYLRALGVRLLEGRWIEERDAAGPRVMLVNRAWAQRFSPDESPVGTTVSFVTTGRIRRQFTWEVVGVIENIRWRMEDGPDRQPRAELPLLGFMDLRQLAAANTANRGMEGPNVDLDIVIGEPAGLTFAVRRKGGPLAVAELRNLARQIDPAAGVDGVSTMGGVFSGLIGRPRFYAVVLSIFGGIAGLIAAIGIYGVLTYAMTQRTQEFGIRLALGARRSAVFGLVLRQGAVMIAIGIPAGIAGALALTRYLESMLVGVKPLDAGTYVIVTIAFAAVALLASYVPARRATRVDPMVALRYE